MDCQQTFSIDLPNQLLKPEGVYRLFQLVSRRNVIYADVLYDTKYLPVSPISTNCLCMEPVAFILP